MHVFFLFCFAAKPHETLYYDLFRVTFAEHQAVTLSKKRGSTVFLLSSRSHSKRLMQEYLLTPAHFHHVGSQVLKGCDLKCYINSPLFSLSAKAVQALLPLI